MTSSPVDDPGEVYSPLFHRLLDRLAIEQERAREDHALAAARYDELMALPRAAREAVIRSEERFASFSLGGLLLDTSLEVHREDPEAGLELSRLALAVADRIDPERHGSGLVADLRARCWAYLGEAWSSTDRAAARRAFRRARSFLLHGSGDPLAEAEVLCLAAGLLDSRAGRGAAPSRPLVH